MTATVKRWVCWHITDQYAGRCYAQMDEAVPPWVGVTYILSTDHDRVVSELRAQVDALSKETQTSREALHTLTTATAMLDLGQEEGDERAVVRNVLVGIRALQDELSALRQAVGEAKEALDTATQWSKYGT